MTARCKRCRSKQAPPTPGSARDARSSRRSMNLRPTSCDVLDRPRGAGRNRPSTDHRLAPSVNGPVAQRRALTAPRPVTLNRRPAMSHDVRPVNDQTTGTVGRPSFDADANPSQSTLRVSRKRPGDGEVVPLPVELSSRGLEHVVERHDGTSNCSPRVLSLHVSVDAVGQRRRRIAWAVSFPDLTGIGVPIGERNRFIDDARDLGLRKPQGIVLTAIDVSASRFRLRTRRGTVPGRTDSRGPSRGCYMGLP